MAERRIQENDHASTRLNRTIAYQHESQFPPLRAPKVLSGFIEFIRTQGVVGLGVGFVVGTSANTLIKSVVDNLINPIVGWLTGGANLASKVACINRVNGVCKNTLSYGQVVSDLITFIVILLVVYFIVKSLKLDRLDKPKA